MASATVRFRANMPNVDVARSLLQGPLIIGNRPGDERRPCLTSADVMCPARIARMGPVVVWPHHLTRSI